MGTMLDYIKEYGRYSFREMPLTEVDSLALCQLSYLKFDGIVPDISRYNRSVALKSLKEHPDYEKLFADVRYAEVNRALIEAMLSGARFRELRLNCYVNVIEKRWETQFSALTYFLDDGTAYVAYRGTDETIVGWKEDFNMAFLSPVPGQEYSVDYLNFVGDRIRCPLYVGGHSKGGNLAVYSAMNCKPEIQDRILRIYSMDGPGFRPEVLENGNFELIADRVKKILPHSSLVGMLFESNMRFQVVESKTFGLAQHDPYTWLVEGDHLKRVDDIYEGRKRLDNTLNTWILSLDEAQLRTFVDTLYQVISASEAEDLIQLTAEWKRSMNRMIAALKEVDGETMKILKTVIRSLFEIARADAREEAAKNRQNIIAETKERLKKQGKPAPSRR
ncbi:MAG: DUF2974 domain-containing protein [Roseburia sp.]|nr:DUF2974 domain-containing protein [Roseburia sp.]MCM1098815.1 DUF2974 domain-containing protein [Ruminococcus flavefaciens]